MLINYDYDYDYDYDYYIFFFAADLAAVRIIAPGCL